MKILWIVNTLFPDVCEKLNIPKPVVGGWMYSAAKALIESNQSIELAVLSLYDVKEFKDFQINNTQYFLVPNSKKTNRIRKDLEPYFIAINNNYRPDIVHIHGSEYPHSLASLNSFGNEKVLLSVQGLVSIYQRYYYQGISILDILLNTTIRDIIRNDSIFQQKFRLNERGIYEQELIRRLKFIVGRTSWDKAHIYALNPEANYFYCNETLRLAFYDKVWNIDTCVPHSIFLSQAHYPIKGLHQLLKALPLIISQFPDTKVYIAGNNILNKQKILRSGYANIILKIIRKYKLNDSITFLGTLDEQKMSEQYCKANVFVCPSTIENSPNSVGESQIVGTPCVASYVGGTMDMIEHGKTGLMYRFEETEMLANNIIQIFSDKNLALKLSENARIVAKERHNHKKNTFDLIEIYKEICKKQ